MEYQLFHNLKDINIPGKSMEEIKAELYALWIACFGDTKSYTDFYFKWKVKDNQILTLFKDGKPSSMLHLNPYTIVHRGERLPANYIVGVATKKEDRRQGLMKQLIDTALNQMYKEKMPFTYLMPAAEAIYRPFDFRIVYKQENWDELLKNSIDNSNLSKKEELFKEGTIEATKEVEEEAEVTAKKEPAYQVNTYKVFEVTHSDTDKMKELIKFSRCILEQNYTLYAERTEYYYQRLLYEMESTNGGLLLCYKGEEVIGYTSYMADSGIHLTECIYKNEEKNEIFRAFANYFQIGSMNSITDRNGFEPTIMTRIVNWQAFAEKITSKEELSLIIEVKDPIIKENNGIYEMSFNEKGCTNTSFYSLPDSTRGDYPYNSVDISMDIAELTKLFFGCFKEEEILPFVNREKQKEILIKLDKLFIYKNLFINDVV